MATYKIELEQILSETFIDDVVTAAVEGGINYWVTAVNRDGDAFILIEEESGDDYRLTNNDIAGAIQRLLTEEALTGTYVRDMIRQGVLEHDAGHIDADGADVIVQVAALGEVVYG